MTGWRGLPPVGKSDPACSLHTRGRGNERACERTDARTDGGGKDIHENPHTSVRSSQPRVGESHLDNDLGDEVGVRGQGCGGGAQDRARRVRGDRTGEPTRSKETSARRRPLGHACAGAPIKRITVDVLFPHPPRPGRPHPCVRYRTDRVGPTEYFLQCKERVHVSEHRGPRPQPALLHGRRPAAPNFGGGATGSLQGWRVMRDIAR